VKRLQIFRKGKHTSTSGAQIEFSDADLLAAVANYDPKVHEAPITIGHPKDNKPAFGWIGSLAFADPHVEAEAVQVAPEFAELVSQGRFKKISASWYTPDSPHNPKPGAYYLRHVAFLGAQPPAVKGLRDVNFADGEGGYVEFADWSAMNIARVFLGLYTFLAEKFGKDVADKVIPSWALEDAFISAAQKPSPNNPSFSEQKQMTPEEIKAKEEALAAREKKLQGDEAAFAERNTKLSDQERATRRKTHVEFIDGAIKDGKILPKDKDGLVAFMDALADGVVEFGEGDKATKKPQADFLRDFIGALPKQVEFRERGGAPAAADVDVASFGENVDADRLEIHRQAVALAKEKGIPYRDAASQLINQE
jgi:hypothetical protein